MSIKVVAFTGKKQAGKDLAARLTRELASQRVSRLSFAHSLKKLCEYMLSPVYALPPDVFWGTNEYKEMDLEEYGLPGWTGRKILQFIGTDCFRHIDQDYWVNRLEAVLEKLSTLDEERLVVVTDLRFLSEAEMLRDWDALVIRLLRFEGTEDSHASETEMEEIESDYTIENTGTVNDLKFRLNEIYKKEGVI